MSILIANVMNSASGRWLVSILVIFLEFCPILSLGIYFFIPSFLLPLCVCAYVLNRSALFPSLGRVALCSRCPIGPSGAISLITWARCSKGIPCVGCVYSPVVVEPWFLLEHQWMRLTLRLIGWETWPWLQWTSCCVGADPMEQDLLWWDSGAYWVCPLGVLFVEVVQGSSGVLIPGLLGKGLGQPMAAAAFALPGAIWATKWSTDSTCAGLGGSWERLTELRLAAPSGRLAAA